MKPMNAEQRRHAGLLADAGCCVPRCGKPGPIHHEFSKARGFMKSHDHIACLCLKHHVGDTPGERVSRHELGRDGFNELHNMDIWIEAGY